MAFHETEWAHPDYPGVKKLAYPVAGGGEDWALAWPGDEDTWVVHLHGHGSTGDQLFTREDVRTLWLPAYRAAGYGVLSPHLRGNAWMCPEAVEDLSLLLAEVRRRFGARRFAFVSGSMGGTGNLIYAVRHPEEVAALVALCPATEVAGYTAWCGAQATGIIGEIYQALVTAYGGTPDKQPERYAAHSAVGHADRLTMPVYLCHGDADTLIPVTESHRLLAALPPNADFTYRELPGGGHDAPLYQLEFLDWLRERMSRISAGGSPASAE